MHACRQALADRQMGIWHFFAKGAGEGHRQDARNAGRKSQGNTSCEAAAGPGQFLSRSFNLMQNPAAMFQQQLTSLRGTCTSAIALQKVLSQLNL